MVSMPVYSILDVVSHFLQKDEHRRLHGTADFDLRSFFLAFWAAVMCYFTRL